MKIVKSLFYLLKYFEYFMIFFMVSNNIRSQKQIKVFTFFIILTAVLAGLYGLHTARELGRASAPFDRIEGASGEPNTLGGYLLFICALLLGLLLHNNNPAYIVSLGAVVSLVFYAMLQTLSRGSYLGFLGMLLPLMILTTRKKLLLVLTVAFLLVSAPTLLPKRVISRINETFIPLRSQEPFGKTRIVLDESATNRVESWKLVLQQWKNSPILGYGVTGMGLVDTQYPLVLGEAGMIGLVIFIWLLATIYRNSVWIYQTRQDNFTRGLCLGYICGFVGLLLHSFSAATFIIVRIMEPFWFVTAMVMMLPEVEEGKPALTPINS